MLNFLALLGWSPGDDSEVMTLDEMIELFSLDGLQKKAAIFDPKKLEWMNGQHLSRMSAVRARAASSRRRSSRPGRDRRDAGERGATGILRCSICSRCARARY